MPSEKSFKQRRTFGEPRGEARSKGGGAQRVAPTASELRRGRDEGWGERGGGSRARGDRAFGGPGGYRGVLGEPPRACRHLREGSPRPPGGSRPEEPGLSRSLVLRAA